MNQAEVRRLDAIDAEGRGLRVELYRVGPRWAHRLLALDRLGAQPLLESVEGDEHQVFPPSPALQQLSIERRDEDLNVALLVGMAGKNHWSMGIEAFARSRRIRFDVACRMQPGGSDELVSTYHVLVPWQRSESGVLQCPVQQELVRCLPQQLQESPPVEMVGPTAGRIVLRVPAGDHQVTYRWCYEFAAAPSEAP